MLNDVMGIVLMALASSSAVAGDGPAIEAQVRPSVEQCELKWQAQDGTWSTYTDGVRVGSLAEDESFELPAALATSVRTVVCKRSSLVPMENDWKVLAIDLPLALTDGEGGFVILERDHDRARATLRRVTLSPEEKTRLNAYLGRTNALLQQAPRVRRPDVYKGLDVAQLDCQDMTRLAPLAEDEPNRVGDWLLYGRDANADGRLDCQEFNYTTRVTEVDAEGHTTRVMGRDGRTGSISSHHPREPDVLTQFGELRTWYRERAAKRSAQPAIPAKE
jgi:hypothetical protein